MGVAASAPVTDWADMTQQTITLKQWELDPTVARSWSAIKRYWRYWRLPCARCGKDIDYDGYRYYWVYQRGTPVRICNQWSLDVGHIINRMDDPRLHSDRWDSGAKYAPEETQPEHVYCNRSAGARDGNRKRRVKKGTTLRTSRRW